LRLFQFHNAFRLVQHPVRHRDRAGVSSAGARRGLSAQQLELELEDVAVFLVHLSLKFRHRHDQLRHLHELVKRASKPVIVAGDFNTFWGDHEIYLFMEASGLKSANRLGLPSYPSRNPRKELDFVLYSNGIEVTQFDVPDVRFSDHRPLICDFQVRRAPT
jgi:endonuclease/exonuclease/phosphatase family metal-dependent hydrolase